MSVPTNDARALHNVLEQLLHASARPSSAWSDVLGADWDTLEFTRRHADVMSLYVGTLDRIAGLNEKTRSVVERYAPAWWNALVVRDHGWAANIETHATVDNWALDQLAMLADLVESTMQGSLAVAVTSTLDDLRGVCEEWVEAIQGDSEIPTSLRSQLIQDLRHVTWLIDHAELLGAGRVAAATARVVGGLAVAGQTVSVTRRDEWVTRAKKLVAALVLLGGVAQGVDVAWSLAEGTTEVISEIASTETSSPRAPGPDSTTSGPTT